MSETSSGLAVCIPTFRRPHLLRRLLEDLTRQTVAVDRLVVVDGDPSPGDVWRTVRRVFDGLDALGTGLHKRTEVRLVRSNHSNLPYQRFLGWRAARGARWLLYLDDDLRLSHSDCVERLVHPLRAVSGRVVGVTAEFARSSRSLTKADIGGAARKSSRVPRWRDWIHGLSPSPRVAAGGLTPSGHRRPLADRGKPYEVVGCLRGGAMAFRMSAITADCFSDSLFALAERGWGFGEDSLLSRRIGSRGILLTAFHSGIIHPHGHPAVAYNSAAFWRGYATAYSRRLINDNYRGFERPRWSDRVALIRSYGGHAFAGWLRGVRSADPQAFAFALGYSLGAVRGVAAAPKSARLTPQVDWWADAESALAEVHTFTPSAAWLP